MSTVVAVDPDWSVSLAGGPPASTAVAIRLPEHATDYAELSYAAQIDLLAELERAKAFLDAHQQRVLAALATHPARPMSSQGDSREQLDKHWVREDVSCALRLSSGTAISRLATATALVTQLPAMLDDLEAGVVTMRHSQLLADAVAGLEAASVAQVETRVLPKARLQSPAQFRRSVHRAVLAVDPREAEQKHQAERADRHVATWPAEHGMAFLRAYGPAEDIHTIATAAQAVADRARTDADSAGIVDCRDAAQLRFDALTAIAVHVLDGCESHDASIATGTWQRRTPSVQVTVALSTLLGLDENAAELAGYGPVTADAARRLAADPSSSWRRLVTDDVGALLDYGRSTYKPPQDLIDFVAARDATCRFPHCNCGSRRSELDHRLAWHDGGQTSAANLDALSPRHHHLKHEAGWTVAKRDDGTMIWTSPSGHCYEDPPQRLPVDQTAVLLKPPDPDLPPF